MSQFRKRYCVFGCDFLGLQQSSTYLHGNRPKLFLSDETWFPINGHNKFIGSLQGDDGHHKTWFIKRESLASRGSLAVGVDRYSEMASASKAFWPPFSLSNGHELPAVGLGTFKIKDTETILTVVDSALKAGYRSFDTAAVYGNERFIGEALTKFMPKYDLVREDIHVTSKLSNADHDSKKRVMAAFAKTEANLGFAPDLYLIHFPGTAMLKPKDKQNRLLRHSAWSAMAELYDTGCVDSIGVSNFTIQHLEQLLLEYHSDIPAVNQVEWHPLYYDNALLEYCNKNAIQMQGYQSLGGTGNSKLLTNPVFKEIADEHAASVSQVLLTWSLHKGVAVIPKSINSAHISENFNLNFMLSPEEVQTIDTFAPKQKKFAWDPKFVL